VRPLARERVQIDGEGCHQSLALTRAHLGNMPFMQRNTADQLHVEVAHSQYPVAGLAYNRKGFRQQVIQFGTVGELFLQRCCLALQRLVREL